MNTTQNFCQISSNIGRFENQRTLSPIHWCEAARDHFSFPRKVRLFPRLNAQSSARKRAATETTRNFHGYPSRKLVKNAKTQTTTLGIIIE